MNVNAAAQEHDPVARDDHKESVEELFLDDFLSCRKRLCHLVATFTALFLSHYQGTRRRRVRLRPVISLVESA